MSDVVEVIEDVVNVSIDETHIEVVSVGTQGPPGPTGAPATNLVTRVAGKQGDVTLVKADVGLDLVDNTADVDKPVSTAQQNALNSKVDKVGTTNRVYGTDGAGAQTSYAVSQGTAGDSVARRNGNGQLSVSDATTAAHAVSKGQHDLKADFPVANSSIPVRDATGLQGSIGYATAASANSIARRTASGVLTGTTASAASDLVPKAQMDALVPIYGTGFPNGVVTATQGRIYIDTVTTNGVSSWIKKSGTGNTGWEVLEGDTGWRNAPSTFTNGWTAGEMIMRRIGKHVYIRFEALNPATMTAIPFTILPSGFRAYSTGVGSSAERQFLTTASNPAAVWRATGSTDGTLSIQGATTGMGQLYGTLQFATNNDWPTTLPGTAL